MKENIEEKKKENKKEIEGGKPSFRPLKSNKFSCVIQYHDKNKNIDYTKEDILNIGILLGFSIIAILHDKDIKENGELKTPHYHVMIILRPKERTTEQHIRKLIMLALNCEEDLISSAVCRNIRLTYGYFLHFNDTSKTLYSSSEIFTNDKEKVRLLELSIDTLILQPSDLIELCCKYNGDKMLILQYLGFEKYREYKVIINDICFYIDSKKEINILS